MNSDELGRVIRFGVSGAAVTIVYVVSFTSLVWVGLWEFTANLIAVCLAIFLQYLAQARFTFRRKLNNRSQVGRFAITTSGGLAYSTVVSTFLGPHFGWPAWKSAFSLAVTWPILNYIVFRFWVFATEEHDGLQ